MTSEDTALKIRLTAVIECAFAEGVLTQAETDMCTASIAEYERLAKTAMTPLVNALQGLDLLGRRIQPDALHHRQLLKDVQARFRDVLAQSVFALCMGFDSKLRTKMIIQTTYGADSIAPKVMNSCTKLLQMYKDWFERTDVITGCQDPGLRTDSAAAASDAATSKRRRRVKLCPATPPAHCPKAVIACQGVLHEASAPESFAEFTESPLWLEMKGDGSVVVSPSGGLRGGGSGVFVGSSSGGGLQHFLGDPMWVTVPVWRAPVFGDISESGRLCTAQSYDVGASSGDE